MKNGRLTVGLAQLDVALGDRERNLERHRQWVRQAADAGVELLVFPELSLTGYFIKDLVPESAIRLDDPVMRELGGVANDPPAGLGGAIQDPRHRHFYMRLPLSRC